MKTKYSNNYTLNARVSQYARAIYIVKKLFIGEDLLLFYYKIKNRQRNFGGFYNYCIGDKLFNNSSFPACRSFVAHEFNNGCGYVCKA